MEEFRSIRPRNVDGRIRDAEDLGNIVRSRRKMLGLTQVELAESCRCSPRFIGDLERGVAGGNIKQVVHVLGMLGVDLFAKARGEKEPLVPSSERAGTS